MNICEYGCNKIGKYRIGKKKQKGKSQKRPVLKDMVLKVKISQKWSKKIKDFQ